MPEEIKNGETNQDTNTDAGSNQDGQESLNSDGQDSGDGNGNWYDGLPEEAQGFENAGAYIKDFQSKHGAPEEYEINAPDGYELNSDEVERVKVVAKELGLSNQQLQSMVKYDLKRNVALREAQKAALTKAETDLKADWGNEYNDNLRTAKEGMRRVFDDDFINFLESSGLGNHPEMIKGMHKLGIATSEDSIGINSINRPAVRKTRDDMGIPIIGDYDYMDND